MNILQALKEYTLSNENSKTLPDSKFIQEFCTYLFQTNIFKNLDSIIELLKSGDMKLVNDLRKSQNFEENLIPDEQDSSDEEYKLTKIREFDQDHEQEALENQLIQSHFYERL